MAKKRPLINWQLTRRVHEAVAEDRVLVGEHFLAKMGALGIYREELKEVLLSGVVLSRKERDELKTAVDGYKHFLEGFSSAGRILEVVFKFVRSISQRREELVVLITVYRGRI